MKAVYLFIVLAVQEQTQQHSKQVQETGIKIVNIQKIHRKLSHDWKKVFTKNLLVMKIACGHIRIYW